MAKVLGEAGRYVSQEAARKHGQFVTLGLAVMAVIGVLMGYLLCLGLQARRLPLPVTLLTELLLLVIALLVYRSGLRKLNDLEKARLSWRKGATGEVLIGLVLRDFPDDFMVINGLSTPYGDLDHVVVGPTGVFVIDTKNWKGIVSADGRGDLLLNGKPREKPTVKPLVGRALGIRDAVIELCKNDSALRTEIPFFHVVLAFPSAKVEAKWGSTGSADCVNDETLWDYIVDDKRGRVLQKTQIESIARAFSGLARMDKAFETQSTESHSAGSG